MNFKMQWINEDEAPDAIVWEAETAMANFMRRFQRASELMFHTLHVGEDPEGPIVMAYGKDGEDDTVFLHYLDRAFA